MARLHRTAGVRVDAAPFLDRYQQLLDEHHQGSGREGAGEGFSLAVSPRNYRSIRLAYADGDIDYWAADRLAVEVLGLTPHDVWGTEWWEADELLDLIQDKDHAPTRAARQEARELIRELRARYPQAA